MKIKPLRGLVYLVLVCISVLSVFSFFWMLTGMTNSSIDIMRGKMTFGTTFIKNITTLFNDYNMGYILFNSVKITGFTVIFTLIICSMAAYGFCMYRSTAREQIFGIIMLTMMIPFAALMIPLFQILSKIGILNTHFGLIITSISPVFIIFFFRQSFTTYPTEVLQAARVDGAGEFRTFFSVFVPSMKSTYFAAAIFSFITSWNAYMWLLIIIQSNEKKTTTLLISYLSSAYNPQYGVIMTAIVISTLPTVVVFFVFQRQFVQGMLGSVKQ